MKQYLTATGIVAACIGVVLGVLAIMPEAAITKAKFERVEVGMTLESVEAAFGRPADETLTVPDWPLDDAEPRRDTRFAPSTDCRGVLVWRNEDGSGAGIYFVQPGGNYLERRAGRVYHKNWQDSAETIGEKLRRWVRWPWW